MNLNTELDNIVHDYKYLLGFFQLIWKIKGSLVKLKIYCLYKSTIVSKITSQLNIR